MTDTPATPEQLDRHLQEQVPVVLALLASVKALTDHQAAVLGGQVAAIAAEADAGGHAAVADVLAMFAVLLGQHAAVELDRFRSIIYGASGDSDAPRG